MKLNKYFLTSLTRDPQSERPLSHKERVHMAKLDQRANAYRAVCESRETAGKKSK